MTNKRSGMLTHPQLEGNVAGILARDDINPNEEAEREVFAEKLWLEHDDSNVTQVITVNYASIRQTLRGSLTCSAERLVHFSYGHG